MTVAISFNPCLVIIQSLFGIDKLSGPYI